MTEEDASKANERAKDLPQAGDAEAAFAAAEVKLDADYGTPTQHHNPIELFTTTCVWRDGELTDLRAEPVRLRAEEQRRARSSASTPEKVHVVSPFVGGAFGSKAQFSPRTGLDRLRGQEAQSSGEARRDARPGLHHPDLSRRNAPPHPHRRTARRQDHRLHPRRLGSHVAARPLRGGRRRGQRAALRLTAR